MHNVICVLAAQMQQIMRNPQMLRDLMQNDPQIAGMFGLGSQLALLHVVTPYPIPTTFVGQLYLSDCEAPAHVAHFH